MLFRMLPTISMHDFMNALMQTNQRRAKRESYVSWTYYCIRMYLRYQQFERIQLAHIALLLFY